MFFQYGDAELIPQAKGPKAGGADRPDRDSGTGGGSGFVLRPVVHHIVGQQISTKAQATIWNRMRDAFGTVNAEAVLAAGTDKLQAFGISYRKRNILRILPSG